MIERQIEKPVTTWASDDGWEVRKCQWVGHDGAPDRLFMGHGRMVYIEFKKPKGHRKQIQIDEGQRIIDNGGEFYFCESLSHACIILRLLNAPTPYSDAARQRFESI